MIGNVELMLDNYSKRIHCGKLKLALIDKAWSTKLKQSIGQSVSPSIRFDLEAHIKSMKLADLRDGHAMDPRVAKWGTHSAPHDSPPSMNTITLWTSESPCLAVHSLKRFPEEKNRAIFQISIGLLSVCIECLYALSLRIARCV